MHGESDLLGRHTYRTKTVLRLAEVREKHKVRKGASSRRASYQLSHPLPHSRRRIFR